MTRAERLHQVLTKMSPALKAMVEAGGQWGAGGAPYSIEEFRGRTRIVVTDPETGDRIGASGATLEEALTALETKVLQAP